MSQIVKSDQKSFFKRQLSKFGKIFRYYLVVDSREQPTYLMTRQHIGSYFAVLLAIYNTFLLRQKILKNSIYITRSTNPKIVKTASVIVGSFYYLGLLCVWHIPSFCSELAVRVYSASQNAMSTILLEKLLKQEIFSEKRIQQVLKRTDLNL